MQENREKLDSTGKFAVLLIWGMSMDELRSSVEISRNVNH